jgi:hypothetical protein
MMARPVLVLCALSNSDERSEVMTENKRPAEQKKQQSNAKDKEYKIPKPESSSEYEGAESRKPTGNPPVEVKTETSSSSGE